MTPPDPEQIRRQLQESHALFAPVRARFGGPGVERGGQVRAGFTPVYQRRFGAAAPPDAALPTQVETSFTPAQLQQVSSTITLLRGLMLGQDGSAPLSERIVACFRQSAHGYFRLALLQATEALLRDLVRRHPEHAASLDALFRVAGGEGFRDLILFYCGRMLERALSQAASDEPDLLAFVLLHEREGPRGPGAPERYEVWCPGNDFARAFFQECQRAADVLVRQHRVRAAAPAAEELGLLPGELSGHLNAYVARCAAEVLRQHAIE
jgi:hypothetical protein